MEHGGLADLIAHEHQNCERQPQHTKRVAITHGFSTLAGDNIMCFSHVFSGSVDPLHVAFAHRYLATVSPRIGHAGREG